jgi:pimeloyl-ACP methyl ester carboxylesterase
MPFGLAVLGADRAGEVIDAYPEIDHWVLGGHSLGGAMSAQYADDNAEQLDGLVMWGAYPAEADDLSDTELMAVSVYASEDGLSTVEEVEGSAAQMPASTEFVLIEGGNHAGFGLYGPQDGDGIATITPAEQEAQAVAATIDLLEAVSAE